MNENKTPAPKGVYNCAYMGATRSAKSNNAQHFILSVRLRPLDCGVPENEVCEYFAELPLCYKIGVEYGFYDPETKTNKRRKTVAKDTETAIDYARKCFPAWAEYVDALPDTASFAEAFAWFDEPHGDVTVRANVKEPREYNGKLYYEANVYEANGGKSAVGDADGFNAEFGNVFKAAKVKFGGKTSALSAPAAPKKAPPAAPKKPAAPAHKAKEATRDEAWEAFFNAYAPVHGEAWCADNFVAECEKIIGGEEEFATPELWGKCVVAFSAGA